MRISLPAMMGREIDAKMRRLWVALLFALLNLAFLLRFADRDGYEGDDLNSILPMLHLSAAKQGLIESYRYAWQPLSYELGAALWRLFGSIDAIFLSSPIAGAIQLGLLLWMAIAEAERARVSAPALAIALVALLAVPEFWFSALYYNSTMPGMPLAAAALLLLRFRPGSAGAAVAGLLFGASILIRADFILIAPLLAMASWRSSRGIAQPIILATTTVVALAIGWAAGILDLAAMAQIQHASAAEISARANFPGWDRRMKLGVFSVCLSPIGWALLLIGGPLLAVEAWRGDKIRLLWLIAALPTVYPLLSILSPKYMLPLALLLPLLFVHAQAAILHRWPPRTVWAVVAVVTILPILVSISFYGHTPYVALGGKPLRPVGTHDGNRGYGGYLWTAMATDAPSERMEGQPAADALAARFLSTTGPRTTLIVGGENVFEKGGTGWRHLQLILEKRGLHGTLIASHSLRFTHGAKSLTLAVTMPRPRPADTEIVDLR